MSSPSQSPLPLGMSPVEREEKNASDTPSSYKRRKEVALIIETSNAYARNLLYGIVDYIRKHENWIFHLVEKSRGETPPDWLENWKGHGIIARIENKRIAESVTNSNVPAIDLSAGRHLPFLPWVETDDRRIAHLAYDHFHSRGFTHYAFVGDTRFNWSKQRGEAFKAKLKESGLYCFSRNVDSGNTLRRPDNESLIKWLKNLPTPIAVFACYDLMGHRVLEACREAGLSVPEEVAVLGVDDDELICELSNPPLSSIIPNAQLAGYTAAEQLDHMMNGFRPQRIETLIPPIGVTTRHSTDILAINDREVALALRFIREHACDPISVSDLLKAVPLSRRALEGRFSALLKTSPHKEILNVRLNRIKQLLIETDFSIEEIAYKAGFEHPEYMGVVFKRELGETPHHFRKRNQYAKTESPLSRPKAKD